MILATDLSRVVKSRRARGVDPSADGLAKVLEWARRVGQRSLLVECLIMRARLHRFRQEPSAAIGDLLEALELAQRHGLGLLYIDVLLERGRGGDVEALQDALSLSSDPKIDYAWGRWEALVELHVLEARQWTDESATAMGKMAQELGIAAVPTDIVNAMPTQFCAGCGPLDRVLLLPWTRELGLFLPCEDHLHESVSAICDDHQGAQASELFSRAWFQYQTGHTNRQDELGPCYHLGVLMALGGKDHASLIAEDLLKRRPGPYTVVGAILWAYAHRGTHLKRAVGTLQQAVKTPFSHSQACLASAYYNMGVLKLLLGDHATAQYHFELALQCDTGLLLARQRMAECDDEAEGPRRCLDLLEQVAHALHTWRRQTRDGSYPVQVEQIVPYLFSQAPRCPQSGVPIIYIAAQRHGRFLLHCPTHRNRLDSTLGLLHGSKSVSLRPDDLAPGLLRVRDRFSELLPGIKVRVASAQTLRILEE